MKHMKLAALASVILLLGACTIHMPFDPVSDYDFRTYSIVFEIAPDDALILVDGRLIGEAYEFSQPEAALRLRGSRHEIVIKREGYREEVVNLREYGSGRVVVRRSLIPDTPGTGLQPPPAPVQPEAKTVEPKPLPDEDVPPADAAEEAPEPPAMEAVTVSLEVKPAEAAIYLNGDFWGISPPSGKIDSLRLMPGTYTIEVVRPGYASVKKVLEVKDKALQIVIALEKK